ncbi:MAG: hypothetical protein LR001_08415 [Clostridiales bacterium]|nr:hypothetical protein [Clostridiales bacterium]
MYRVGLEHILGFKKEGDKLRIDPCIPKGWKEFKVVYRFKSAKYNIHVTNPNGINQNVKQVIVDGILSEENYILLVDDNGMHKVEVLLG